MELSSAGGVMSKAISALFPQTLLSWLSKILPLVLPKLPKIQQVSDKLKGKINLHYDDYDEIYLIAHSMGGLVARHYLYDMLLTKDKRLKIKKLMLYAVPNNGSSLAKVSNLYGHTQIKQLDDSNDFIIQLNRAIEHVDLSKIEIHYVVGLKDIAVSEHSAIGEHSNRKFSTSIDETHFSIVKPETHHDDSFLLLKKFIDHEYQEEHRESKSLEAPKNTPFTKKIIKTLLKRKLITLFSQDFTNVSTQQSQLREGLEYHFKEGFHHLYVPQTATNEQEFFSSIAKDCALDLAETSTQWERDLSAKLKQNKSQNMALFITGIEGEESRKLILNFAQTLRRVQDAHPNIFVVVVGKKNLASLVEGKNSKLSPFNTSSKFFFENSEVTLDAQQIRQEFENLKEEAEEICSFLDDEVKVKWTFHSNSILHTLFWRNLMVNEESFYSWRTEEVKTIAKDVFGC